MLELSGLLVALATSYLVAYWVKRRGHVTYQQEVSNLFELYWTGNTEDELYTWMKVRKHIEQSQSSSKSLKLTYVQKKLERVNKKNLCSSTKISAYGEILVDEVEVVK